MKTITRQACPACAKREGVPLVFGFPHAQDFEREERGEVILAGCVVDSDSDMQCQSCDFQWSSLRQFGERTERGTIEKPTALGLGLQSRERVGEPSLRDAAVTRRSAQPRRPTPKVSLVPTIAVFVAAAIATSFLVGAVACSDGWASASIGRSGACSHHGGVNHLPGILRLLFSLFVAWYFHLWGTLTSQLLSPWHRATLTPSSAVRHFTSFRLNHSLTLRSEACDPQHYCIVE